MIEKNQKSLDMSERTLLFSDKVIMFCENIPHTSENLPLIIHLVKSSKRVFIHLQEAEKSENKKLVSHKMGLVIKDITNTINYLKLMINTISGLDSEGKKLIKEANELSMAYNSIYSNIK